jgi:hypothetical protein
MAHAGLVTRHESSSDFAKGIAVQSVGLSNDPATKPLFRSKATLMVATNAALSSD